MSTHVFLRHCHGMEKEPYDGLLTGFGKSLPATRLGGNSLNARAEGSLDGLIIPPGFALPSLVSVRTDAVEAKEMQERPEDYQDVALFFPNAPGVNAKALPMHLKLALIFNNKLPNLFRFSYFVLDQDVPEDVRDACIWALSVFIRIMEECPESILRAQGHVRPGNDYRMSRYITLLNARGKITYADRAREAISHAKAMVEKELTRGDEMWLQNPMPFEIYGEALVLSRTDDKEAANMLRRAMLGIESVNWPSDRVSQLLRTRAFLSRALRNIGEDYEAKTHESWVATWFRKNPRTMLEKEMKYILLPGGPILDTLGGEKWLETRKQTTKADQRITKGCRTCGAREPFVMLLRCNNCKYIYYCSRECQRNHWKHHNELVETQKKIALMALTDSDGAKRAADWSLWCNSNHNATQFGVIHALGLHRDPKRGRTHIVFKQVEYVPTATKVKHKFRIVACGVFLIKDVLRDIETVMRLDLGEGQGFVDTLFYELDGTHAKVPFVDLSFGDGVSAWLGSGAVTTDTLHGLSYDPDWRKRFNVGAPPGPLVLKSGAKDVEHVF
ncbi:hypothetical protein C8F04DRAFT_1101240 [Mycena alexandri]|uniref:MYND-type domain-containing protein n=1 Tax=Mycena alexandri TaxID=1745969 RepID=A0AAD6X4G3_9AGAR|nr:hypothetical protein C8F04DRAFT_1101240 [Mycena alexandri]